MKLKMGVLGLLVFMIANAFGISLSEFHKWARKESGKTGKELVNGYDSLCTVNQLLADAMLKKYRNKTIDALRRELRGDSEKLKEEEEDWGI